VREDEHAKLALGDRLGCDRVDALDDDVILGVSRRMAEPGFHRSAEAGLGPA
jgi:hypothetical protein